MNYNDDTISVQKPCGASLAICYVPYQKWRTPLYDPMTALERGTVFPELDLPYLEGECKND